MAPSDTPRPLRADAARNHRIVLDTAARLVAERGAEQITLDRVAHAAGVGKGTVQRRFGTRAGLLQALLERQADTIRAGLRGTTAPLGRDAPPYERLLALLAALGRLAADNASLLAEHEQACAADKYADPSYRTWHHHLAALVADLAPDLDAGALAHLLLATIDGRLVRLLDEPDAPGRFQAALTTLATAVLGPDPARVGVRPGQEPTGH